MKVKFLIVPRDYAGGVISVFFCFLFSLPYYKSFVKSYIIQQYLQTMWSNKRARGYRPVHYTVSSLGVNEQWKWDEAKWISIPIKYHSSQIFENKAMTQSAFSSKSDNSEELLFVLAKQTFLNKQVAKNHVNLPQY